MMTTPLVTSGVGKSRPIVQMVSREKKLIKEN
jgi:hypothetical protein